MTQNANMLSPMNRVQESNERKIQLHSSSSLTTGLNDFNIANFIAPKVARYLGVRSLVRFGASSKYNFTVMTNEIECRKKDIANIEVFVVRLLNVSNPFHVPSKFEYSIASEAATYAMNLIDDEVNILKTRLCTESNASKIYSGLILDKYQSKQSDVFLEERKKFLDYTRVYQEPLHILPRCFYFPPKRNLITSFSRKIFIKASFMARQVWLAHKVIRTREEEYYKCVKDTAHILARDSPKGMIDAFRICARKLCYIDPNSRFSLWSTLEMADRYESQTLGMANTMSRWLNRS